MKTILRFGIFWYTSILPNTLYVVDVSLVSPVVYCVTGKLQYVAYSALKKGRHEDNFVYGVKTYSYDLLNLFDIPKYTK